MNSNTTPTDVHVITERDVYESTIRKATSMGDLNASPLAEPQKYSWSDVEMEEQLIQKEEPKEEVHVEEPKEETVPTTSPVQEHTLESPIRIVEKEQLAELVEKLMTEIMSRNEVVENVKKSDEVESDDDIPNLVEMDSDNDSMPDLVESESDNGPEIEFADDTMIAIFKRPSCPRCEAALKVLMAHEEGSGSGSDNESEPSESSEEDDSDSDYVPSETDSSDSSKTDSSDESEIRPVRATHKRNAEIPSEIKYTFIILVVLYILKVMYMMVDASMKHRYRACY